MNPKGAMIFAAGFGTRMMPLTAHKPKPMVPLNGRPMIDYAISAAKEARADPIVANLHYQSEILAAHLPEHNVITVTEWPEILDTGGGLKNARNQLSSEAVWTVNPDAIWQGPNPLVFAGSKWDPVTMDALLVCVDPQHAENSTSSGDFVLGENGLAKRGAGVLYGGVQIIKLSVLDKFDGTVFSLNAVWDHLIASGRCYGTVYSGKWCDVGTPQGIPIAEKLLNEFAE